jgi:hypothetical protein
MNRGMSGSEILCDLATGALAARAVEPDHGEADEGHTHEAVCLNCGTALIGSHCHACGQAAHVHRTLAAFFHDLLHGVFHFEGKLWRTLPALIVRPGRMTREYVDGRRASYVSPVALFLFTLFMMFAVVKAFGPDITNATDVAVNGDHIKGLEANRAELARLQRERARLIAQHLPTDAIEGVIEGRQEGIAAMEALHDPAGGALSKAAANEQGQYSNIPAFDRAIRDAKANPQLAMFKVQSNAYKFAWLLILLSVPFVWLLFPFNRRFGLYDHTVFVTYSLCFMMLMVVVVTLGAAAGFTGMAALFVLVAPVHIYAQVRHAYGLGRISAIWRSLLLASYALVALILFGLILLTLGALE